MLLQKTKAWSSRIIMLFGLLFSSSWVFAVEVNSSLDADDISPGDQVCATAVGECTLRAAISEVNALPGAQLITIRNSLQAIQLNSPLTITDDVVIKGDGVTPEDTHILNNDQQIIVKPKNSDSVTTVQFENLVIRDGKAETLGSLVEGTNSKIILKDVKLRNSDAGSRAVSVSGGYLEVENSIFTNNNAALHIENASLLVKNSQFIDGNWDEDDINASAGIYLNNVSSAIIKDSQFTDNIMLNFGSAGGAIHANSSDIIIDNTSFRSNSATDFGGAIFIKDSKLRLINNTSLIDNSAQDGGGLYVQDVSEETPVYIENTVFSANLASAKGGAIFSSGVAGASEVFSLKNSLVYNNKAQQGGGLYLAGVNSLFVNSTINKNESTADGGGLYLQSGAADIQYLTVFENTSVDASVGNIFNNTAVVDIQNSIVANPATGANCSGSINSNGNNIDSENSCQFSAGGDMVNTDPILEVMTIPEDGLIYHRPVVGSSPAIDMVVCSADVTFDQIYAKRTGSCDIGAIEVDGDQVSAGAIEFASATYEVNESEGSVDIVLTRSGGAEGAVSVIVRDISLGSAIPAADDTGDYTVFGEQVITWDDGNSDEKTFTITLNDDDVSEGDKTIFLEMVFPTNGATLGATQRTVIDVLDEEYVSLISFLSVSTTVSEDDALVKVSVIRVGAARKQVEVDVEILDGSALYSADYASANGKTMTIVFEPDEMVAEIEILLVDDIIFELTEAFSLVLSNPVEGEVNPLRSGATVTIEDNDSLVRTGKFSFESASYSVNEFDGELTIPVERLEGDQGTVKLNIKLTSEDNKEPSAYILHETSIEFKHRETKKSIVLDILDNDVRDGDLKFKVVIEIANPESGLSLGDIRQTFVNYLENEAPRFRGFVTEDTRSVGAIHPLILFAFLVFLFRGALLKKLKRTA